MSELPKLPKSWTWAALELLTPKDAPIVYGIILPGPKLSEGIPYVRPADIKDGNVKLEDLPRTSPEIAKKYNRASLKTGDLVFSIVGTIGKWIIVPEWLEGGNITQSSVRIRPIAATSAEFILQALNSQQVQAQIAKHLFGNAVQRLNVGHVRKLEIPLPPLNEQRRIVAKIEALSERSRRAREALEAIPPLLERFRQSVLAAAFRGDLTREWREQNPDVEPAWYEQTLAAKGCKFEGRKRRKGNFWGSGNVAKGVSDEWGPLPPSWRWVRVADLGFDPSSVVQIGPMSMKSKEFTASGTRVLNVGCVQWGRLNMAKCNYLPPERASDFERYRLHANDVMFTRSGTVGRSAVLTEDVDGALMTFHLLRVRTSPELYSPYLLFYAFQGCPAVLSQVEGSAIGATRAGFNTKLLEGIFVPLPPPAEQREVVRIAQERLATIQQLHASVDEQVAAIMHLDQAILAKAFRGELVPQDPNDEPASVLLERIRAEREAAKPKKRRGRAKKAKASAGTTPSAPAPVEKHGSRGGSAAGEADAGRQGDLFTQPRSRPATKPSEPRQDDKRGIDDYTREEIEKALRDAWGGRDDVEPDEVLKSASRALGFKRLGSKIRERLELVLEDLE